MLQELHNETGGLADASKGALIRGYVLYAEMVDPESENTAWALYRQPGMPVTTALGMTEAMRIIIARELADMTEED
jgi:hypothetical protein